MAGQGRTWLTTLRRVLLGLSAFVLAIGLLGWAGLRFEGEMFAFMGLGAVAFLLMMSLIMAYALLVLAGRRQLIIEAFRHTQRPAVLILVVAGFVLAIIAKLGLGSGTPVAPADERAIVVAAAGVLTAMFAMMAGFAGMLAWATRRLISGEGTAELR